MTLQDDFFKMVRNYLTVFLPKQKCYSGNTIKSYRDALNLFVGYLRNEKGLKVSQITFSIFTRQIIIEYLDWLQEIRLCSTSSRNQRLMALRSFLRYAGMMDCTQIAVQGEVVTIPIKKENGRIVEFLTEDALQALLAQPNTQKLSESRNRFFMILMYETAARCGEMLNLRVRDIHLNCKCPIAYLTGKGNKTRIVPLMSKTVLHCTKYLEQFHPVSSRRDDDFLFYTTAHGINLQMSADNVACFMKRYGEMARSICPDIPKRVHPHQLRHTRSIHLYRDGMPLPLLAEYLGHANMETTQIYAYADTEMKRTAIQKAEQLRKSAPAPEPIWVNDEEMILKLSGLK